PSGHRGSSLKSAFNDDHIAAITQAIVEYRASQGITGPLFMGRDTHALSAPAQTTALEVLVANEVRVLIDEYDGFTPTPAVSHAIIRYNRTAAEDDQADGIVITPSHNPPADGGFKYNPPHGGPADTYGLDLTVVNPAVDPTWAFMTLDWDEKIRMDPSSPSAMASVVSRAGDYDILTGNDADADRHGIVTPDGGLMNPNHYLAVAIQYLFTHRPDWPAAAKVGKTLVSSSMIDRVAESIERELVEVPVGFKWFVPGLIDGSVAFGGEESAGASFLRTDGTAWTTDKDGILLALLASEIRAVTGRSPSELYRDLTERFGDPVYQRVDAPASPEQKTALA